MLKSINLGGLYHNSIVFSISFLKIVIITVYVLINLLPSLRLQLTGLLLSDIISPGQACGLGWANAENIWRKK
jgi:hypothetical protein